MPLIKNKNPYRLLNGRVDKLTDHINKLTEINGGTNMLLVCNCQKLTDEFFLSRTKKRMYVFFFYIKVPEPDDFQAIFFQNQWQVIGNEFYEMVKKIFEEPASIKEINGTLITFIPKKEVVSRMKDFRSQVFVMFRTKQLQRVLPKESLV